MAADRPAYFNGEHRGLAGLRVPALDHGFLFADGVYELIPVFARRARCLDYHLERLAHSLDAIGLAGAPDAAAWRAVIAELSARTPEAQHFVYLQVTRGAIPPGAPFRKQFLDGPPTVFGMTQPLPEPPASIRAITRRDRRWGRCHIKSLMLLETVLATQAAADQDAGEAILHRGGRVTEGATSNVFAVIDGALRTPPLSRRILYGVTRRLLLELLRADGVEVHEEPLTTAELTAAEELWVTGSTRGVLAVTELDGRPVGAGEVGAVARAARARYEAYCAAP